MISNSKVNSVSGLQKSGKQLRKTEEVAEIQEISTDNITNYRVGYLCQWYLHQQKNEKAKHHHWRNLMPVPFPIYNTQGRPQQQG